MEQIILTLSQYRDIQKSVVNCLSKDDNRRCLDCIHLYTKDGFAIFESCDSRSSVRVSTKIEQSASMDVLFYPIPLERKLKSGNVTITLNDNVVTIQVVYSRYSVCYSFDQQGLSYPDLQNVNVPSGSRVFLFDSSLLVGCLRAIGGRCYITIPDNDIKPVYIKSFNGEREGIVLPLRKIGD